MGVLAHHGHPHGPRPVVVEVGPLVSQALDLDHVVAGRVHCALPHRLRD